jgi:putative nucleotidyltransferase with HDIG domain
MLLTVVFNVQFAILIVTIMATLAGLLAPMSLPLTIYLASGGLLSALTLRDAQRVTAFFRAGLVAALGHIFVIVLFAMLATPQQVEPAGLLQQIGYGLGNGLLSSALTMAGFYVLGGVFGIMTILQLLDLSRLDHPLLRELLRRAPGTYHHSIMVANLAEQAAERIGANSALVRVGAFYHDVGKMIRPPFFVENQEGINPHNSLDPYTSARIIISHVPDGLELARKYRIPHRIRDFIAEHHGERLVKTFLRKAQEAAQEAATENTRAIDENLFRYPGPRPRSRESAIVMLADAIDATSTALRPDTESAIVKLVETIIEDDLLQKQLQHSGLTLGDVEQMRVSFIETLKGRFHVRVAYPGNEYLLPETNVPVALLGAPSDAPVPVERPLQTRLEPTR